MQSKRIGETKLKILAIIHHNNIYHGYGIWTQLKDKFHCYLDGKSLRNVYHHLHDLKKLGLIKNNSSQNNINAPQNLQYELTDEGRSLKDKFNLYLKFL